MIASVHSSCGLPAFGLRSFFSYNPLASPLLANDFAGLAPALVMTAGFDPLRDEGAEYADKLTAAGVPVEYLCYRNQIHGFVSMAGAIDEGRQFLDQAAAALRKALHA